VLAARGEWVTNEKRLLAKAGLRAVDEVIAGLRAAARSSGGSRRGASCSPARSAPARPS
ncbi:nucleotidyltransferase domain-containing protein, partial [Saccharopolyspora sp. NPDC002686]